MTIIGAASTWMIEQAKEARRKAFGAATSALVAIAHDVHRAHPELGLTGVYLDACHLDSGDDGFEVHLIDSDGCLIEDGGAHEAIPEADEVWKLFDEVAALAWSLYPEEDRIEFRDVQIPVDFS